MIGEESLLPAGRTERMSRLRRTIATRMVQSLQASAQLTTVVEADFSAVDEVRRRWNAGTTRAQGERLSFLPFVASAALQALERHPMVNASVDVENGTATYYEGCNLAVAVDTERGLVAPVVRNAAVLSVPALAAEIARVAATARSGRLMPDDLAGGTFTITNTGSRGALFDTPIVNPPQVAILGSGAVVDRAVVVKTDDGEKTVAIRPVGYLALSYDHRLVDGADAARFLTDVRGSLQQPAWCAAAVSAPD